VRDRIAQERDRDAAGGAPPERREEQERQPRDDGADDRGSGNATPPPLHEPRSLEEPVGGAAPDEREVPGRLALGRGYRSTPALLALSGGIHPCFAKYCERSASCDPPRTSIRRALSRFSAATAIGPWSNQHRPSAREADASRGREGGARSVNR